MAVAVGAWLRALAAVLVLGNEACAFKTGSMMKTRLHSKHAIMANMTTEKAMSMVLGMTRTQAKPELVSLIQSRLGHRVSRVRAASRAASGLRALRRAARAGEPSAGQMLNELMEESQMKLDLSDSQCGSFERKQFLMMDEAQADVASFNSLAADARGHVLKAQSTVGMINDKVPKVKEQLNQQRRTCASQEAALKRELAIVEGDLGVMDKVLAMTECKDAPALLQTGMSSSSSAGGLMSCAHCGDGDGNGIIMLQHDGLQPMLMKLKSQVAQAIAQQSLSAEYQQSAEEEAPVALTQEQVAHHAALVARHRRGRGRGRGHTEGRHRRGLRRHRQAQAAEEEPEEEEEEPSTGRDAPRSPEPFDCAPTTKCTLSKTSCESLREKFELIKGSIEDKRDEIRESLANQEEFCQEADRSFSQSLVTMGDELREGQTDLAMSTKDQVDAEQQSSQKGKQHESLQKEYQDTMQKCCDEQNGLRSELCALEKIRGELRSMQGTDVFITDCEVGDWEPSACSATCGGGSRRKSRRVLVQAVGDGVACPPLVMDEACNEQPCPIDCLLEDWDGWSACTALCGGGVRERARSINRRMQFGGAPCDETEEEEVCNLASCDRDCVLGEWSEWSACNKGCGGGHRSRTKGVAEPALGTGTCAKPGAEERLHFEACNAFSCESLLPPGREVLNCASKIDVIILLDSSGSLGSYGWGKSKAMAEGLVKAFNAVGDQVKVALYLFSSRTSKWIKHLNEDTTEEDVQGLSWIRSGTWTAEALGAAEGELLYGREDANSVVVVVTDGRPRSPRQTKAAAKKLQKKARVVWVPVGRKAPIALIRKMASEPKDDHVIEVPHFYYMSEPKYLNQVISDTCPYVQ